MSEEHLVTVSTDNAVTDSGLTEGQKGFFDAKKSIIDGIEPATDNEVKLKGIALLLLNGFRDLQAKANRLASDKAAASEKFSEADSRRHNAERMSKAMGGDGSMLSRHRQAFRRRNPRPDQEEL